MRKKRRGIYYYFIKREKREINKKSYHQFVYLSFIFVVGFMGLILIIWLVG